MKPNIERVAVFAALVALGVAGRFLFRDIPNFTPTTALALFAGFYFRRQFVALAVPLCVMALSNLWLPAYQSGAELLVIYAALVLPVVLGRWLRRGKWTGVAVLAPSLVFYLVSNLAVWACGTMYAYTLAGLLECYVNGLPFYRWMLAGDLLFAALVFGVYGLARASAEAGEPVSVAR